MACLHSLPALLNAPSECCSHNCRLRSFDSCRPLTLACRQAAASTAKPRQRRRSSGSSSSVPRGSPPPRPSRGSVLVSIEAASCAGACRPHPPAHQERPPLCTQRPAPTPASRHEHTYTPCAYPWNPLGQSFPAKRSMPLHTHIFIPFSQACSHFLLSLLPLWHLYASLHCVSSVPSHLWYPDPKIFLACMACAITSVTSSHSGMHQQGRHGAGGQADRSRASRQGPEGRRRHGSTAA